MNYYGDIAMPYFVKTPNLPLGNVCVAAVGEDYAEEIGAALMPYGIKTLACPNNSFVDERLRSHIDLTVLHVCENRFIVSGAVLHSGFLNELRKLNADIIVSDAEVLPNYPFDAGLCVLSAGDRLFHNFKFSDSLLHNINLYKKVQVSQGYAKCAVCLISATAAITADHGMAGAMKSESFDVLEISSHGIELKGYDEGFIGGAAFKMAGDKLAFTGILSNHPDRNAIEGFLNLHGIKPVFLTDKPIFDVGSVLPIAER
jgi:hypothetical protein